MLLDRAEKVEADETSIEAALEKALQSMSVKEAASFVAQDLNVPRRQVYQIALDLRGKD